MKKRISVVSLIPRSGRFYARQVQALFGERAEVMAYSTGDGSVENIEPSDLYMITTDAFKEAREARKYVPMGGQIVMIQVTYSKKTVRELRELPKDQPILFVNATQQMAREAITQLEQLGVSQVSFAPYGPDSPDPEGFSIAVTPDEAQFVPAGIERVINIGHRPCTAGTMIEAAIRLGLEELLDEDAFREYMRSMEAKNYSFEMMFHRSQRLESRFDILLEILDEGLIGVNEEGEIFACNRMARDITGVDESSAIGKRAEEIFPYIPFRQVIEEKASRAPRIVRVRGVNINTAVVPVLRQGECIGAFATLQRFNEQERRQNELRSQLLHKGYRAKYSFEDFVGDSPAVERTKEILKQMAVTELPVLLIGETGTGKELLAHAIHRASSRSQGPFLAINVAAMPENLLESERFGYEEGAFTGAKKGGRPGLFEFAHKGTLFLDEVEGMSQAMQVKLLRVLQEREIMRVGGNQIISVDVRIVAATNESLEEMVEKGSFRRDLYYRLNALPVLIPPLRERGDDIFLLFDGFCQGAGGRFELSEAVRGLFRQYKWPGNVRELQNVAEYLSFAKKREIQVEDLPPTFLRSLAREEGRMPDLKAQSSGGYIVNSSQQPAAGLESGAQKGRTMEFWFVLEQLYTACEQGRLIGREAMLRTARARRFPISQKEIRDILIQMDAEGIAKVTRGRGGSRITENGQRMWENR